MMGAIFNAIGILTVSEERNVITVRGIHGGRFEEDVQNQWKTSKIYGHIFKSSNRYGFSIDSFFAVDLLYVLRVIVDTRGKLKGSRRQYVSLIENLLKNTWLNTIENPVSSQLDYGALGRLRLSLFEHQMNFLRVYDDRTSRYRLNGYILGAAPGSGKALANGTLVKVKGGWSKIEDLVVGEFVVGQNGRYTKVTGVFPQGKKQLYEITFEDGRTIKCCAEHLWKYYDNDMCNVDSTSVLIEKINNGSSLSIPLAEPVTDERVQFIIDPYIYGVMLSDTLIPVRHERKDTAYSDVFINHKTINEKYLNGNIEQRFALINGIMDNGGYFNEKNVPSINTTNNEFLAQLVYLIRSVGGIATADADERGWIISIRLKRLGRLFRKTTNNSIGKTYVSSNYSNLTLGIKSINKVEISEATCISVADKEKLFVTENFIVTHNTITNFALSECLNTNTTIIIVPKNSVDRVWKDTLETLFKETPSYWISSSGEEVVSGRRYYVAHYEQLEKMLFFARGARLGKVNIILDESHNFNDLKSNRTQMFCDLVKASKSISTIFASGTPVKAMGSEVIPILRSIDPFFFPKVEERFKKVFGLSTSRGLDILANRMGLITFKVDKAVTVGNQVDSYDVDVVTPTGHNYTLDKIRVIMSRFIEERMKFYKDNLQMFHGHYFSALEYFETTLRTSDDWADYKKYKSFAATIHKGYDPIQHVQETMFCNNYEKTKIMPALPSTMKESFKNAKSVYKYYHLKVQGEALGRILGKMRTQCNVEMVQAMDNYTIRPSKNPLGGQKISLEEIINQGKKKTVIFTSYVDVVDTVNAMLKERGFMPVVVYGDTNKNLAQLIEQFEKNPDLNPVIATFPSLSTAVPLVMANQAVMLNAPFRIHEHDQAVSRMDRIGQTEIVNVFNIYLDTGTDVNISTRSLDIMAWSKSQVDAIMGISTPTSMFGIESMLDSEIDIVTNIALENCEEGDQYIVSQIIAESKKRKLGW